MAQGPNDGDDGGLVAEIVRRGRAAWPEVDVTAADLAAFVARGRASDLELVRNAADVYLACACRHGEAVALRAFEATYMPVLARVLGRFRLTPAELDELGQRLRVLLFTGPEPCIEDYGGVGPLQAWLRTIINREAVKLLERDRARDRQHDEDAVLQVVSATGDPELTALRHLHQERFQRALDQSILTLSPRAKAVLRLHYVQGLNIDAIGDRYGVHRATVARWLTLTRSLIVANLRRELSVSLQLTPSELRTLTGALLADLHISVDRVLRTADVEVTATAKSRT